MAQNATLHFIPLTTNISNMNISKNYYPNIGYYEVNLTNIQSLYNLKCFLRNNTERIENDTLFIYSEIESVSAGVCAAIISIFGTLLNMLIIIALLKSTEIRKEDFTRFVISLALCDLAFSIFVLPFNATRFLLR